VTFDYPRPGFRVIGFVTRELVSQQGERLYAVFMPTVPNPTTGYLLFMPVAQTHLEDITVEDAVKMVVSGGVVAPGTFHPWLVG
jgi:uncharacterized membrane protein